MTQQQELNHIRPFIPGELMKSRTRNGSCSRTRVARPVALSSNNNKPTVRQPFVQSSASSYGLKSTHPTTQYADSRQAVAIHRPASYLGSSENQKTNSMASNNEDYIYRPPASVHVLWDSPCKDGAEHSTPHILLSPPFPLHVKILASPLVQSLGSKSGFFVGKMKGDLLLVDRFDLGVERSNIGLEPTIQISGDTVFTLTQESLSSCDLQNPSKLIDGAYNQITLSPSVEGGNQLSITLHQLNIEFRLYSLLSRPRIVPTLLVMDFLLSPTIVTTSSSSHGYITLDQKRHIYCMTEQDALSSALEYVGLWLKWDFDDIDDGIQTCPSPPSHLLWPLCVRFMQENRIRKMSPTGHKFLCLCVSSYPKQSPSTKFFEVHHDPKDSLANDIITSFGQSTIPCDRVEAVNVSLELQKSLPVPQESSFLGSEAPLSEPEPPGANDTVPSSPYEAVTPDTTPMYECDITHSKDDIQNDTEKLVISSNISAGPLSNAVPSANLPVPSVPLNANVNYPSLSNDQLTNYVMFLQQQLLTLTLQTSGSRSQSSTVGTQTDLLNQRDSAMMTAEPLPLELCCKSTQMEPFILKDAGSNTSLFIEPASNVNLKPASSMGPPNESRLTNQPQSENPVFSSSYAQRIAGLVGDPDESFVFRSSNASVDSGSSSNEDGYQQSVFPDKPVSRLDISEVPTMCSQQTEAYSMATLKYLKKYNLAPNSESFSLQPSELSFSSSATFSSQLPGRTPSLSSAAPFLQDSRIRQLRKLR